MHQNKEMFIERKYNEMVSQIEELPFVLSLTAANEDELWDQAVEAYYENLEAWGDGLHELRKDEKDEN